MQNAKRLTKGPVLPYRPIAGVEPCAAGWLVVGGKLQGVNLFPDPPQVYRSLRDVLDVRPPYEIIALHCPIGLPPDHVAGGRTCDRAARRLLGPRRGAAILSPPPRSSLDSTRPDGLSAVAMAQLPWIREVHQEVASYHQKVVFEVHPELGFYQLNQDEPLTHAKATPEGLKERETILRGRLPGVERVLDNRPKGVHIATLLDACADIWTARRIAARAIARLPETPEWNEDGLKMELVR